MGMWNGRVEMQNDRVKMKNPWTNTSCDVGQCFKTSNRHKDYYSLMTKKCYLIKQNGRVKMQNGRVKMQNARLFMWNGCFFVSNGRLFSGTQTASVNVLIYLILLHYTGCKCHAPVSGATRPFWTQNARLFMWNGCFFVRNSRLFSGTQTAVVNVLTPVVNAMRLFWARHARFERSITVYSSGTAVSLCETAVYFRKHRRPLFWNRNSLF